MVEMMMISGQLQGGGRYAYPSDVADEPVHAQASAPPAQP